MDIKRALDILNIPHEISLKLLKLKYRALVKKHHPDISENPEKIIEINEAYRLVKLYIENYKISIKELINSNIEEKTLNRFKNDWLGGNFHE
jgi:hypothetical protein